MIYKKQEEQEEDEITYSQIFEGLGIEIELPQNILDMTDSVDLLDAEVSEKDGKCIITLDSLVITIDPNDEEETIRRMVERDGQTLGGIIIGYETVTYLN
jgi:hypothetical protein